ncbi:GFA family protein [Massilia horti]|uniref:GFA family protein n=1 Tax=Massilia horti TaxID=2562153 RepID=A0A4Y9SZX6_9BURK|nr:GFA family protein [Massilia horti]TFW31133.1 GFA family protein [Massilia horti]
MQYKGSCHCGQIAFEVEGSLGEALECNCSHCSRKGYLLWFVPATQFTLNTPEAPLSTYTFNRHVIKHRFCPTCGCAPFANGTDRSGAETVAVNVRCLEDLDLSSLKRVPVDGRSF